MKVPKIPKYMLDCGNKHKCKLEEGCQKHLEQWKAEILGEYVAEKADRELRKEMDFYMKKKTSDTCKYNEYCPRCGKLRIKNIFGCHCNGLLGKITRFLIG